jgi:hypothetical protein
MGNRPARRKENANLEGLPRNEQRFGLVRRKENGANFSRHRESFRKRKPYSPPRNRPKPAFFGTVCASDFDMAANTGLCIRP